MKLQLLPVRVDHHVDVIVTLRSAVQAESQTAGVIRQVCFLANSVPVHILPPEAAAAQRRMLFSKCNHALEEAEYILICLKLAPVQPSRSVVLVVGIVVAVLGVQEFVA